MQYCYPWSTSELWLLTLRLVHLQQCSPIVAQLRVCYSFCTVPGNTSRVSWVLKQQAWYRRLPLCLFVLEISFKNPPIFLNREIFLVYTRLYAHKTPRMCCPFTFVFTVKHAIYNGEYNNCIRRVTTRSSYGWTVKVICTFVSQCFYFIGFAEQVWL